MSTGGMGLPIIDALNAEAPLLTADASDVPGLTFAINYVNLARSSIEEPGTEAIMRVRRRGPKTIVHIRYYFPNSIHIREVPVLDRR